MTLKTQIEQLTETVQAQSTVISRHEQDLEQIKHLLRDMRYDVTQARKWSKGYL
jgi:hypothetical protein